MSQIPCGESLDYVVEFAYDTTQRNSFQPFVEQLRNFIDGKYIHVYRKLLILVYAEFNLPRWTKNYKCLANAKRPHDCSVLCLRMKSSLCSCSHCILDITSFGSADSARRASNNGVGQFKPIFQVEANTFTPIFFGYFIADWLLYNFASGSFTQRKFVADFIRLKLNFILIKNKKSVFEPPFGGLMGKISTPSIARWKPHGRLYISRNWTVLLSFTVETL